MVQISFVLVVHREQAHIEECVRSILDQEGAEIELIVIDDASPDHGPGLLDDLAAADRRLRLSHLAERVGVGAARNLALDLVTGEYVWFVETRDRLGPGAVLTIAEGLRRSSPDVLIVDHDLVSGLGAVRAARNGERLAALAHAGPGTLVERRQAADLAPGIWDKVLRTEHLRTVSARFGSNAHDELVVVWRAMIAASVIDVSATVSYVRREPPGPGSHTVCAADIGVLLDEHDAVWDFLLESPRPTAVQPIVRDALLRQALSVLERADRSARMDGFARAAAAFRARGGPERAALPRSLPELRTRLVMGDHARAYDVVARSAQRIKTTRTRVDRAGRHVRGAAARVATADQQRRYRQQLRAPIDPDLALFSAYWNRGYQCNPRAIFETARELVPSMRGVWIVTAEAAGTLPPGTEHVIEGTHVYYEALARARVLVNNVNFPNDVVKRRGTTHVMTHHGTPLKRMGTDLTGRSGKRDLAPLLRRVARWDYSISSNPFSTLIWERVFPGTYETLEVGYPRNDVLARAGAADVAAARAELGIAPDQLVVLHAPTHREYRPDWIPTLDVAAVADGLGPDAVVLDRRHYFYGSDPRLEHLQHEGRVRDVSAHPSVEQLCLAADVLVSDYSSIIFDYAVLDRPIVTHAPDWEVYRTMRGTYFDLLAEPPGAVTRTAQEVVEAIIAGDDDPSADLRGAFRERFCTLDDGHAAERVVQRVWLDDPR
jgi:CDP-glycerol glycerophosphotransferase